MSHHSFLSHCVKFETAIVLTLPQASPAPVAKDCATPTAAFRYLSSLSPTSSAWAIFCTFDALLRTCTLACFSCSATPETVWPATASRQGHFAAVGLPCPPEKLWPSSAGAVEGAVHFGTIPRLVLEDLILLRMSPSAGSRHWTAAVKVLLFSGMEWKCRHPRLDARGRWPSH